MKKTYKITGQSLEITTETTKEISINDIDTHTERLQKIILIYDKRLQRLEAKKAEIMDAIMSINEEIKAIEKLKV